MDSESKKRRDISILEYFNRLQLEYALYELRLKVYPFSNEKKKYKGVLEYKKAKIEDISKKNNLLNIFNCENKRKSIYDTFYDELGVPRNLSGKDKYFYYTVGAEFSFQGADCILVRYNFSTNSAVIKTGEAEQTVQLQLIKRIL